MPRFVSFVIAVIVICLAQAAGATITLPDTVAKRIKADPVAYIDEVAALIAGYGRDCAIDAGGIDLRIAMARAAARVTGTARLLRADLDGDGAVAPDELAAVQGASSAQDRGKLAVTFARADGDANGTVDTAEVQALAATAALSGFGDAKAAALRGIMAFDVDGDGKVTLNEVRSGLTALGLL